MKQWSKQIKYIDEYGNSYYDDKGFAIAIDGNNNLYIAGSTDGAYAGYTNQGASDLFFMKLDSNGTQIWVKQMGTNNGDYATNIAVDTSGNVYVSGITEGALGGNTSLGSTDVFILKYSTDGVEQWVRQLGTTSREGDQYGEEWGGGVAVDSSGNVYVTDGTSGAMGGTNQGSEDIFIAKYNNSGTLQWTKQIASTDSDYVYDIAVDSNNNIYVTGVAFEAIDGIVPYNGRDILLVKYNSSGVRQWTRMYNNSTCNSYANDRGLGLAIDADNYIYVGGTCSNGIVLKYDSSGNLK
ncbi:SBBP repeat-containing protein [Deltaproteobacteria bacterium TL4]